LRWIDAQEKLTEADRADILRQIEGFFTQTLISIILPVYNVEEKLAGLCIDSVLISSIQIGTLYRRRCLDSASYSLGSERIRGKR